MRSSSTRLAAPLAVVLLAAACSRNDAPAGQQAAPATSEVTGTENSVTPPPAESAPVVEQAPIAPSPEAPAPAVVSPAPAARSSARSTPADRPTAPVDRRATAPLPGAPVDAPAAVATEREAPRPAPARMISIPANTPLRLALQSAVASDTSSVEDRVSARVTDAVVVDGETVIPEGSRVDGRVTYAQSSGKVKGRAGLTVRFHTLTVGSRSYDIVTEPLRREAQGTKAKDARNIGIGAGAGAVIGGIIGGRKGAGIGAAVGGAGGAGAVLATKGEEVRLPAGTAVTTRLADPLVVDVRNGGQ